MRVRQSLIAAQERQSPVSRVIGNGLRSVTIMMVSGLLWAGCADDLDSPDDFTPPTGGAQITGGAATGGMGATGGMQMVSLPAPPACAVTIFAQKCGTSSCHGTGATFVDLESAGVSERLLDGASSAISQCGGQVFVSSGGGGDLLLDKVSASPSCGSPMPFGSAPLSAAEVTCLSDYVTSIKAAAP